MIITMYSLPVLGGRIYALVPNEYYPGRRLEAGDPVWKSTKRKLEWVMNYSPQKYGCVPSSKIKFRFVQ